MQACGALNDVSGLDKVTLSAACTYANAQGFTLSEGW